MRTRFRTLAWLAAAVAAAALPPGAAAAAEPDTRAPASQLERVGSRSAFGVTFHRYRQVVDGRPVLGASAVLADARGTSRDLLVDSTRRRLGRPPEARVSRSEAVVLARDAVGARALRARPQATLAILPEGSAQRLVWQVLVAAADPVASHEVLIDALTRSTVRVRDLLRRETGSASIFLPNPLTTNGSRTGLDDANDADSAALTALRRPVTLQRIEAGSTCLRGQWVRATLADADVCLGGRDFTAITRADDRFEAVMAYYHVDRARAYLESLGFPSLLNRQLRVFANAFTDDNSYYDLITGAIFLGSGGVDDGEDGDIIVHEYGHAIQHDQVPGFGETTEAAAMGEGWGDYFAAALDAQRAPDPTFNPCIGEWDQTPYDVSAPVPCIRRTDRTLTAAQVGPGTICGGEEHCAGEAWSGALWAIRGQIGGTAADRLVIQSHFSLTPNATFHDGSRALLFADRTLFGGANQALLRSVLSARGLLDLERLDDTPAEATALAVPGSASGALGGSDLHDLYRIELPAGGGVVVTLAGGPGDLDVRLLGPGATNAGDRVVGGSTGPSAAESFAYGATESGAHYLDVSTAGAAGTYTLSVLADRDADTLPDGVDNCPEASNFGQEDRDGDRIGDPCDRFPRDPANDADGDGIGAERDNCPTVRNATQTDWDADRRGDPCDRSSRARILSARARGTRVSVRASKRPTLLAASAVRVRAYRRVCTGGRCRERLVREVRARRGARSGEATAVFRLRRGRYVLRAVIRATGYAQSTSPRATLTVRG